MISIIDFIVKFFISSPFFYFYNIYLKHWIYYFYRITDIQDIQYYLDNFVLIKYIFIFLQYFILISNPFLDYYDFFTYQIIWPDFKERLHQIQLNYIFFFKRILIFFFIRYIAAFFIYKKILSFMRHINGYYYYSIIFNLSCLGTPYWYNIDIPEYLLPIESKVKELEDKSYWYNPFWHHFSIPEYLLHIEYKNVLYSDEGYRDNAYKYEKADSKYHSYNEYYIRSPLYKTDLKINKAMNQTFSRVYIEYFFSNPKPYLNCLPGYIYNYTNKIKIYDISKKKNVEIEIGQEKNFFNKPTSSSLDDLNKSLDDLNKSSDDLNKSVDSVSTILNVVNYDNNI